LILKLLQPDPKNRYTAKQALNHRWIKGAREDSILDGSVMEGWADHLQLLNPGYMGSPSPRALFAIDILLSSLVLWCILAFVLQQQFQYFCHTL
jgi:serine/threonine protein kinase